MATLDMKKFTYEYLILYLDSVIACLCLIFILISLDISLVVWTIRTMWMVFAGITAIGVFQDTEYDIANNRAFP